MNNSEVEKDTAPYETIPDRILFQRHSPCVTTPCIDNNITGIIRETADVIIEKLGLDIRIEHIPMGVLDRRGFFSPSAYIIGLTLDEIAESNDNWTIVHEASHMIHHHMNPEMFETSSENNKNKEKRTLVELIANYGAFCFKDKLPDSIEQYKFNLRAEIPNIPEYDLKYLKKIMIPPGKIDIMEYETYEGANRLAEYLYLKFGDKYLKPLLHAGIEEARSITQESGYKGNIFVPFMDCETYETVMEEDGQIVPVTMLQVNTFCEIVERPIEIEDLNEAGKISIPIDF